MTDTPPPSRSRSLVRAGEHTDHISLDIIDLPAGAYVELQGGPERLVVVMSGRVSVTVAGDELGIAGGRDDVFREPGDSVYAPPGAGVRLVADQGGDAGLAVAGADAGSAGAGPARIIRPADQSIGTVGRDSWSRSVRTILGPGDAAARLIAGETINDAGAWSSYPPHRHDRESDEEVRLEEVYYFRTEPAEGFGVQLRYDTDSPIEDLRTVHDGDVAVIRSGFHPVVAAPGYRLYYLWIMAGAGRMLRPYFDPRYRWVQEPA